MPYRRQQLVNDEIYHVVVRGIDDNLLFKDLDDHYRGIFSIYEFNNTIPVEIFKRRREIQAAKQKLKKGGHRMSPKLALTNDGREKLIEILAFCFMPNHIHLLLKQLKDNGITRFMRKVGAGYGRYFNKKYNRKGYVFQNSFISVHVDNEEQLKTVFVYVHVNPTSLIEPKWKEKGIKNPKKAIKFLENYKWSSYQDYSNKKNFPSVTDREFILKTMAGAGNCKNFVESWINYKGEIKKFANIALE